MKKRRHMIYFLLVVLLVLISYLIMRNSETKNRVDNVQCIGSFEEYSYFQKEGNEISSRYSNDFVNSKWSLYSEIPEEFQFLGVNFIISGNRIVNGELELWFRTNGNMIYITDDSLFDDDNLILIYNRYSGEWSSLDPVVFNCDCIADELMFINMEMFGQKMKVIPIIMSQGWLLF